MGPARFAVLVALHIRREAFMYKSEVRYVIIFGEVKDQSGVGPFLFVHIPRHVAICN